MPEGRRRHNTVNHTPAEAKETAWPGHIPPVADTKMIVA